MMRLVTLVQLSIKVMFWMHIVGTAHGYTVSPPWVTLSGCFSLNSNKETSNIQKNEPTQCFEMCRGFQSVGLKNTSCICNPLYTHSNILTNRRCNLSCPGKSVVYCGSDGVGNELMSVYRRDASLPDDGNGSSSYGYGYVVISGSNRKYNASDYNMSLRYGFLCYDDVSSGLDQCPHDKMTIYTWEEAMTRCNNGKSARLITVSDVPRCPAGGAFDGTYWIGIYREKPDFTTSTTGTSTSSTETATSSTSSKPTLSFKLTTGSRPNHNSANPVIELTSKASSTDGKNVVVVAISVAVIVVAILVALASILICKKRKFLCFRERKK